MQASSSAPFRPNSHAVRWAVPIHSKKRFFFPRRLYKQVADRAYQESPLIVLAAETNIRAVRSNLQGASAAACNPMRSFGFTGTLWRELSKE
ncbi:hypothetical protein GCM10010840_15050 [Deinococcus aerolatus]|uniref:Uncharacterized protein n=1 Tax=Deinococcus aerolatus TaxID=522487 RepID=A0ABQ2G715_9DEIO|nr:hypothetical protein GCM10010840_15050 [Deinococcus aerolatus]